MRLARATQMAEQLLAERGGPSDASSSYRPTRRKKKRKKKKLPKSSSWCRGCSSSKVVDFPVVTQRLILVQSVQIIIEIPQLQYFIRRSMSLLKLRSSFARCWLARCCATSVARWSRQFFLLWRFRNCSSSIAVDFPVATQRLTLMVLTVQKTTEIPQDMFAPWKRSVLGISYAMPSQSRVLVVGGSFTGFCVVSDMKNK